MNENYGFPPGMAAKGVLKGSYGCNGALGGYGGAKPAPCSTPAPAAAPYAACSSCGPAPARTAVGKQFRNMAGQLRE